MNRLLLDTNAYAAFKRGHPGTIDLLTYAAEIVICPTVAGELLAGFHVGQREAKNRHDFEIFVDTPRVFECAHNLDTAEFYGAVYAALRAKGTPIPTNDMWIAASALQHGLAVCSFDAHFRHIDGLLVINPDQRKG